MSKNFVDTKQNVKQGESSKKKSTSTKRVLHYFWKATRAHLGLFILLILSSWGFSALLTYGNPYVMSLIVNKVSQESIASTEVFNVFGPYIIALILVNVVGQACSKVQDYAVWKLQISVNYDLAKMCFDTLANQSMTFHTNRFGGALVSQTSKFLSAYNLLIDTLTFPFLSISVSLVAICTILASQVPVYVLILMVLLFGYGFVSYRMYKRILHLNEEASNAQNSLSGELSDAVTNILSVKTCGKEDFERKLFDKANKDVLARDSKRMGASMLRGATTAAIAVVIMSVVTVFITGGNAWFGISPGCLILMFTYTYTVTNQFNFINSGLQRFNRAFGDASAMAGVLDEPRLVPDEPNVPDLVVKEGAIDIDNISFSYLDGGVETKVFENFCLNIKPGERIGLVGVSGSGKTTLTKLILRLADIQQGTINIDGQDITKVNQQSLRKNVAYVPQESLLFHRTIAENIAYGKQDATDEEIKQAAKAANALDFILQLPEGFQTITGERGIKLSGGQRQRIVIARAILSNCPILILDEATSALDSKSEAAVQDALQTLMKNRTSIVVAHRLSTVSSLDRIVVLRDGKIVEQGSHTGLVAKGGDYASLWERQTE